MNSWCALIAYVAGKKSQTLFLYLRPDCWALYGITAISDSSWRRSTGDVARPRPQEGTAGSSHTRRLHGHRQEAALPLKFGVFSPRQSINDISDGWWSAGAIPPFRKNKNNTEKGIGMMKCNWKGVNVQKSVPLSPHIWNFLFPRLNYNVINFVNNNYIFHYRIARKGRCKTLSQDSPLSCLVSVCLFN